MRRIPITWLGTLVALSLSASAVWAAEDTGPADCGQYTNMKPQDSYKQNPRDIHECMARGWDPPVDWRPNKGKGAGIRVGGAGGFSHGSVRAADMPPWRTKGNSSNGGGPSSGGPSSGGSSSGPDFPPWPGWPGDSSGSSGSSGSSSGSGSSSSGGCPTSNDDNDATFGVKQPLTGSVALACGGAAPLTTYQLSLSSNADSLLITENGFFNYWLYKKQGNVYKLVSPANAMLPTKLCDETPLQPPIAQMISFSSNASAIAVRLKAVPGAGGNPLDPVVAPALPEKHLVLAISGGTVQAPGSCAPATAYKPTPAIGDIVFDTIMTGGCEAPPNVCTEQGLSPTPTALPDCSLAVSYPSGANCSTKTQVILLDRPNLVYPSGSTATSIPIEGMTSVMLPTVAGSMIQTKDGWVAHLGEPGASFTFPQGGTVGLVDGNRLVMKGPATLSGSGQVTLPKGGMLQTSGGTLISSYPDGTTITPNVIKPVVMTFNQSVRMPAGYVVPSSSNARVRLPITP